MTAIGTLRSRVSTAAATVVAATRTRMAAAVAARPRLCRLVARSTARCATSTRASTAGPAAAARTCSACAVTSWLEASSSARRSSRSPWAADSARRARRPTTAVARTRPATTSAHARCQQRREERGEDAGGRGRGDGDRDPHLRLDDLAQVVDDAAEQVGSAAATEPRRGQRDQPCVRLRPTLGKVAQRRVVRAQPLGVTQDRACDTERADRNDRGEQGEDGRLLAGADDEPAGRCGQRDAGGGRSGAEQGRERERPPFPPPAPVHRAALRSSSTTCRSATATSSRTVRRRDDGSIRGERR